MVHALQAAWEARASSSAIFCSVLVKNPPHLLTARLGTLPQRMILIQKSKRSSTDLSLSFILGVCRSHAQSGNVNELSAIATRSTKARQQPSLGPEQGAMRRPGARQAGPLSPDAQRKFN